MSLIRSMSDDDDDRRRDRSSKNRKTDDDAIVPKKRTRQTNDRDRPSADDDAIAPTPAKKSRRKKDECANEGSEVVKLPNRNFAAAFAKTLLFKRIVSTIKDLFSVVNFECTTFGMHMQTMDASKISFVDLDLSADGFAAYRCEKPMQLGVSLDSLDKILKAKADDSRVTISSDLDSDVLEIEFAGCDGNSSRFVLKLLNIDEDKVGIPDMPGYSSVDMASDALKQICTEATNVSGESLIMTMSPEGTMRFATNDTTIGTGEWTLVGRNVSSIPLSDADAADCVEYDGMLIACKNQVSSEFKLRYLKEFVKTAAIAMRVVLSLHPENPLTMKYAIEGIGHISYYLAPMMKDPDVAKSQ